LTSRGGTNASGFCRVCNPTKIMDAMGSGRPIVATALPECRLHAERFHVAENRDEFVEAIRAILGNGSDDGRAGLRHAYALANTCHGIGERILDLLEQNHATVGPAASPLEQPLQKVVH
jgi:teichuronic acid biosynthesis glycosyltransferase TuaH